MNNLRLVLVILILLSLGNAISITIAFDLTKAETAGNADWTIGSSPNWTGAYSSFGTALRSLGYTTTTLTGSNITASMLTNVKVLVIPEPQNSFSSSERAVLVNFVQSGGGLFLIADHDGSDRNNNGWDSRRVYNESLLAQTNFGISFDANSLYADPTTLFESPVSQLTNGLSQVGMYAGCSITASGAAATRIWLRNLNEEGLVTNTLGLGRVAAYGDSSPFDDGTGNSGNDLHDGWGEYDNAQMALNVVQWLAQQSSSVVSFSSPVLIPTIPQYNQPIEIRVNIQSAQTLSFAYLYWKTTGGFNPILMSLVSGNTYKAIIPAQTASLINYYIQARTSTNYTAYYPENAPTALAAINITPTSVDDNLLPIVKFKTYPNPFNPAKNSLIIESSPMSEICIYDIRGSLINRISNINKRIEWNGMDKSGTLCPAGIYFIRIESSHEKRILPINLTH